MIFVADPLPVELVRIIEFLNEQMNPAEVLGVELHQYVGSDHTVFVPRVVGRTSTAIEGKSTAAGQQWHEQSLLDAAHARRPPDEFALIQRLIAETHVQGRKATWGKGVTPGVTGWYTIDGQPAAVWNLNVNSDSETARAYLYFYLSDLAKRIDKDRLEHGADVLESVPALAPKIGEARANNWNKYPSVYLDDLVNSTDAIDAIFRAIEILTASG